MEKMKVSLLGAFRMEYNGTVLEYHDYRSKQITKLLAYLVMNRNKQIFNTTTADVMFKDNESNDPINALKALIYRVRTVLKKAFGDDKFILSSKGSYYWNTDIEVELDIELFRSTLKLAKNANDSDKYSLYEQAITYYKGRMLPMLAGDSWVDVESQYLESQALSVMLTLIKYYYDEKINDKFDRIYADFLKIDPYNETVHYYAISHYLEEGQEDVAKKYYNQIERLFANDLGIKPSAKLTKLLESKSEDQGFDFIKGFIKGDSEETAFECTTDEFTRICQLEARKMKRSDDEAYVVDLKLTPHNKKLDEDLAARILESTKSLMRNAILASLRSGDCVASVGKDQFLILLNSKEIFISRIMKRINEQFDELDKYRRADMTYEYEDIRSMLK